LNFHPGGRKKRGGRERGEKEGWNRREKEIHF